MNPNRLAIASIVLSILAISLSATTLVYLIYPLLSPQIGKPSFCIEYSDVNVFARYTRIYLRNNGTATAHNVRISVVGIYENDWFIPELRPNKGVYLGVPFGRDDFEHATLYVYIECDELPSTTSFQFDL